MPDAGSSRPCLPAAPHLPPRTPPSSRAGPALPGGRAQPRSPSPPDRPASAHWTQHSALRGVPPAGRQGPRDLTSAADRHSAKTHGLKSCRTPATENPHLLAPDTQPVPHTCGQSGRGGSRRDPASLPRPKETPPRRPQCRGQAGREGPSRLRVRKGENPMSLRSTLSRAGVDREACALA